MSEPALAGWGHRVRLQPLGDIGPPGLWRCVDHSPLPGHWWVMPADLTARVWLRECPLDVVQNCVEWPSRLFAAPDALPLW